MSIFKIYKPLGKIKSVGEINTIPNILKLNSDDEELNINS